MFQSFWVTAPVDSMLPLTFQSDYILQMSEPPISMAMASLIWLQ